MNLRDILSKIKILLTQIAPDARAILYGSQARGDAREDSDIDLLILLPDNYDRHTFVEKETTIRDRLYDLSLSLNVDISALIRPHNLFFSRKSPFSINIANEGIDI